MPGSRLTSFPWRVAAAIPTLSWLRKCSACSRHGLGHRRFRPVRRLSRPPMRKIGTSRVLFIFVRVCVTEAESMATALSRSPLYVRGGHLHVLEEAVRCSLYTSTGRYGLSAVLWHSAREV